MHSQEDLNNVIRRFLSLVSEEVSVKEAYLFGSYAKGVAHEYSDIDMAIVSDDFVGCRFDDSTRLGKYVIKTSIDIEVHPFKTEDFTPDNPFVEEILRTGKRIQWN
ncbi:MAG: nucleotidyltransferase domain-containing protein [Ignavibacteriae bacterium]|nr:nucleotidyltransferase domain-containing protein [Ignavibacteriota bacterium]